MTADNAAGKFICYGEVLWDILPGASLPGGAPMNVAYHLHKLGSEVSMISRTGDDDRGREIRKILLNSGISDQYIQTDFVHETGVVYAKQNEQHEMSYDIVYPVAWDFIEWKDEFKDLIADTGYLVFGTLSSRNELSKNTLHRLIESATTRVFDINLRAPHYNNKQVETLLEKTDILKMNNHELDLLATWYDGSNQTRDNIQLIQDRFNIPTIIVTMGEEGAVVNHKGELFFQEAYKVKVADTIGSGDSFLAGFLTQYSRGRTIEESIRFACAIGALVASKAGGCPAYELAEIDRLINGNAI